MADPTKIANEVSKNKAQEVNQSPITKAIKESLPFVLAAMTIDAVNNGVTAVKDAVDKTLEKGAEVVDKAKAIVYKQVNGEYGANTRPIDSKDLLAPNEKDLNGNAKADTNAYLERNYVKNPTLTGNDITRNDNEPRSNLSATLAENSFGDHSDFAMQRDNPIEPVIIDKPKDWTPLAARSTLQEWSEKANEFVNTAKETIGDVAKQFTTDTKQRGLSAPERTI